MNLDTAIESIPVKKQEYVLIVLNTPLINTNTISIIKIKEDLGYKITYMGWL